MPLRRGPAHLRSRAGTLPSIAAVLVAIGAAGSTTAPAALAADTCPNAAVRVQQNAGHLPDCRAYEQVSPREKGGNDAYYERGATFSSVDGERYLFSAEASGVFGGGLNGVKNQHVAVRQPDGWASHPVSPQTKVFVSDPVDGFVDFACDLCSSVVGTSFQPFATGDDDPWIAGVRSDVYLSSGPGSLQWLSGGPAGGTVGPDPAAEAVYAGRSASGDHVAFFVGDALLPEVAAAGVPANAPVAYERTGPGLSELRVVGRADDGSVMPGGSTIATGSVQDVMHNAVSRDGSKIFFQSPASPGSQAHLYVRIDGSHTVDVSASQCSGAVPTCDGTGVIASPAIGDSYLGASSDGETVYFMSNERLVDEDANGELDIYRYDLQTQRLTQISAGPAGSGITSTPRILRVSDDGSMVYFISREVLTTVPNADGEVATPDNGSNVYAYRGTVGDPAGELRFVGNFLAAPDGPSNSDGGRTVSVTANGKVFLFAGGPYLSLDPIQVYRYSWDTRRTDCLSCDGEQPSRLFSLRKTNQTAVPQIQGVMPFRPSRNMTADGRSVFFETTSALVPRDVNGKLDVYEWRDGDLHLLSSGVDRDDSYFLDASADGEDVFILTRARHDSADDDLALDVYDVRSGGGWLSETPRSCAGDGCQGASGGAPGLGSPGSASLSSPGNVTAPGPRPVRVAAARVVRGGSVTLRVKAPTRGRIRVSGAGLRGASLRAVDARTYRVEVRLARRAARRLERGRRVVVRMTVRFTPESGRPSSARARVTFRPAASSSRRATVQSSDARKGR